MTASVQQLWDEAERLERAGDRANARARYQALLAIDAGFVPAHLRMSRHAQWAGRYRESRRHALLAADAIRAGTGSARRLAHVAQRLLEFAEPAEAGSIVLSADWTHPDVMKQAPALAQCLWLAGRYDDALRFLDAVEPRLPPTASLRLTRGNVLRYLGALDLAQRCYADCLRLDPRSSDAHWALATLSPAAPPDGWLGMLEAARANPDAGQAIDRAQLAYAAFHAYDRLDQPENAWPALEEGMRLMHAQLARRDGGDAHAIESLLSAPVQSGGPVPQSAGQPIPVFIVGLPRTGTTLLDRLLGNHGWVTSVGERNEFAAAASEVSDAFFTTQADAQSPRAWSDDEVLRVGHLYRQRLRALAPSTAFAVDKNPRNLFNLPLILRALPDAKVLILRRDPMDAAFSNLKELFQGGAYAHSYDQASVARHVLLADRWSRAWAERVPASIRLVAYEALVQDTQAQLDGALQFIGLPAQAGLAALESNRTPVATASSAQVRGPLHSRGIGAWRRYADRLGPLRALVEAGT